MNTEITTAAELDALPVGSIVLSAATHEDVRGAESYRLVFQKLYNRNWHRGGRSRDTHPDYVLPATVLYRPDAPQPTPVGDDVVERDALTDALASALAHHVRTVLDTALAGLPSSAAVRESSGVATECERRVVHELRHGGALDALAFDVVVHRVLAARSDAAPAVDDVVERAPRAVHERIEAHWPDAFDGCDSNDTECDDGEDCAADVTRAALAAARAGEVETVVPVLTDEEWATPDDAPAADRGVLRTALAAAGQAADLWDEAAAEDTDDVALDAARSMADALRALLREGYALAARGEAAPSVSVYEQCVTGVDGRCTRWSHSHIDDTGEVSE